MIFLRSINPIPIQNNRIFQFQHCKRFGGHIICGSDIVNKLIVKAKFCQHFICIIIYTLFKIISTAGLIRYVIGKTVIANITISQCIAEGHVKIDRWLLRFVGNALGIAGYNNVTQAYCDLLAVCHELRTTYPHLTPRLLDHTIWNHMR